MNAKQADPSSKAHAALIFNDTQIAAYKELTSLYPKQWSTMLLKELRKRVTTQTAFLPPHQITTIKQLLNILYKASQER